ncbi:unnamed protein product [Paramecium octaurelia]|uniref:Histone deacetylase n=1 Tax=Paramecium octaurelia TaxID=43137 RepID=A0A8S1UY03_PAROT|nr:unnamed protein product [Paramecium octaurelia]
MIQTDSDSSKRVAYFYNRFIGKFQYGKEHPMKPKRIIMAHNLIVNYGLFRQMDVYLIREAQLQEIGKFHDPDYIIYLSQFMSQNKINFVKEYCSANNESVIPENLLEEFKLIIKWSQQQKVKTENSEFKVGDSPDNPTFSGLFSYCQLSSGASIDCAHSILTGQADIAINWSGGLHHAKKKEASGFCYINDIVLCILELLRVYVRVLYVDIDCHHGDGVEEAFYLTNRVMTLSFHQYGDDFYPGTGQLNSVGVGVGRYYSVNVPMKPGMSDQPYIEMFKKITSRVMQVYRPDCIVMQCGADSLSLDKLGGFNLSIKGHGACVEYMKSFGIPMILLGGGGYTIQNVSRCWAYETGIALGQQIDQAIPSNDIYYDYYSPDYLLHFPIKQNVENRNKTEDLNKIVATVYDYLSHIENAPGIHFHDVPFSFYPDMDEENEDENKEQMDQKQEVSLNELEQELGISNSSKNEISVQSNSRKIYSKSQQQDL